MVKSRVVRGERKRASTKSTSLSLSVKLISSPTPKSNSIKLLTSKQFSLTLPFERTVIIGFGVAACTAAIYCSSALPSLNPLIIAEPEFGGQLCSADVIRNWPGVSQTTTGSDLLTSLRSHVLRLGVRVLNSSVTSVLTTMWPYHIITQTGRMIVANSIILATGRHRNGLNLPGEAVLLDRGVYLKSPTSLSPFVDKTVIVIGTSRTAAWEALQLALAARRVTIVCRKLKFSCGQDLQIVLNRSKVNIMLGVQPVAYATKDIPQVSTLCGLEVSRSGFRQSLKADAVFLATNITARTDIVNGLNVTNHGYVITKRVHPSETNFPGLFAAGDIVKGNSKHAFMAASSGFTAALAVQHFLSFPFTISEAIRRIVTPRITYQPS
ncbi:MAG: NAD(P)/FAD-dependent oxidoreductase [Candidatus Hodgkinia cicadicola]